MKKQLTAFCLGLAVVLSYSTPTLAGTNTSLIFIHGANFKANSWKKVQHHLANKVHSIAIDLPGRNDHILPAKADLALAAGILCKAMAEVSGKKILVAHSQGGAVANAALATCPGEAVDKIVYVTSVSPLLDTNVFSLLAEADKNSYFTGLTYDKKAKLIKITDADAMAKNFAHDANSQQLDWIKKESVDEPSALGGSKAMFNEKRYQAIDKYYVFAKNDKIISYATQQKIAQGINLKGSYTLSSGHLPMLTQSKALADTLLKITNL